MFIPGVSLFSLQCIRILWKKIKLLLPPFWIASSAWSLWLPKNHINLQIAQAVFSGSWYYSQAKREMEMSAAAFMTDSVEKPFLLSPDGARCPSALLKCGWDSTLSFHPSPLHLWSIETISFTFCTVCTCGKAFLFKNRRLTTRPFDSFLKLSPSLFKYISYSSLLREEHCCEILLIPTTYGCSTETKTFL